MKCILWIRTSTVKQETETMTNELYQMASNYGYKRDDCIVIGERGISAIKADEAYKEEIDKLYSELNTGKYNCLFAWELSRIGRKEEYVVALKNYLIDHKIQLRIMKPSLYLLEEDGSVNAGMELSLTLLTTLAKQEMKIKQDRMQRGKNRIKNEGKFAGAPCIKFGYVVDDDGYIKEDPVNGQYVRDIFRMYLEGMSSTAIYRNFAERGIFSDYKLTTSGSNKILNIVKNMVYAGEPDRGHIYPALVTRQMVEDCIRISAEHNSAPKTRHKYTYYCKGIIVCMDCGHVFVPQIHGCAYRCCRYGHSRTLNMNVLDYIAWEMAKLYKPYALKHQGKQSVKEYERLSKSEMKQMEQMMAKKILVNRKQDNANELYIEGRITKQKYEEKLAEIALENKKLDEGITDHLSRYQAAERLKNGILNDSFDISTVTDDEMRRKYISETIQLKCMFIAPRRYNLYVVPKVPVPRDDWFEYEASGSKVTLIHHWKDSSGEHYEKLNDKWDIRFKRYR